MNRGTWFHSTDANKLHQKFFDVRREADGDIWIIDPANRFIGTGYGGQTTVAVFYTTPTESATRRSVDMILSMAQGDPCLLPVFGASPVTVTASKVVVFSPCAPQDLFWEHSTFLHEMIGRRFNIVEL